MSSKKLMIELSEELTLITSYAPDEYPDRLQMTFATHKADIQRLWSKAYPALKERDKAEAVNTKLAEMLAALDAGNKDVGKMIAWDLWSFPVRSLR